MSKLRLEIDALHVQSFLPDAGPAGRGTVAGRQEEPPEDTIIILPGTIPIPVGPDTAVRSCLHACASNEYISCACPDRKTVVAIGDDRFG